MRLVVSACALILQFLSPSAPIAWGTSKYWVYFSDKGPAVSLSSSAAIVGISDRSLARRAKVLPKDALIRFKDLPLYDPYLQGITRAGGRIVEKSRWLNAVSASLTEEMLEEVSRFPFVLHIAPVRIVHGQRNERESSTVPFAKLEFADYGPSAMQLNSIDVPPLHSVGISGQGILIGMLDSGFRWRVHESLKTRHVVAEHDFVFNDEITANESGDFPTQDEHGTLTMSVLGGYLPGQLVGPAFGADFMLAKTEYVPTETRIEEDHWQAAIEWMERAGVDVVSSSLGYNIFDPPEGGYYWSNGDFNGRTSVTARAAIEAARLGVVICDAMGNEGNGDGTIGTMLTPADADSIISVGAVYFSGKLAEFSSTGPTNDGRTKPDVVAPGVGIYCASTAGPQSYFYMEGTSLSTPLTAGSAALILSARPELTPLQIRGALRNTAHPITDSLLYLSSPNNFTGWGMIDVFQAALSFGPIFSELPQVTIVDSQSVVGIIAVSRFGLNPSMVSLAYSVGSLMLLDTLRMTLDSAKFFPSSGLYSAVIPRLPYGTVVNFTMTALDSGGHSYQSPAPIRKTSWKMKYGIAGVDLDQGIPSQTTLLANYPNPFNPVTALTFDLERTERVMISIYNILGERVAIVLDALQNAGPANSRAPVLFDARNLPSGVYIAVMTTPTVRATRKLLLVR